MQTEIVHGADPQDTLAREPSALAVHECTADRAEVVAHGIACPNRFVLGKYREFLLASQVLQSAIVDGEI